jgi:branched-chain amino acid aminotransferase
VALPKFAFFKGRVIPYGDAKLGVLTHTFNYGTGIFGGIRGYWNDESRQLYLFRPFDHFQRFLESSKILCMNLPYSRADLVRNLQELVRAENFRSDCYIRPLAYFSDEIIGVRLFDLTSDVTMVAVPFGPYLDEEGCINLGTSSWARIDDNMIPARGKIIGAYVNSALSKTEAHFNGFEEALVLNQSGHVAEGSSANFFMIRRGVVCTPPTTENILEGIVRRTVIQLLRDEIGIEVMERTIDRTEVYFAEEAFVCGTGMEIAPIANIDRRIIGSGKVGPVTRKLRQVFADVVRGRVPKYMEWCHPAYPPQAG